MKLSMKPGGGDFEIAPAGMHPAILIGVVELGTAKTNFGPKNEVQFIWELHGDEGTRADGTPFLVHQKYTASLGGTDKPSNLAKMLTGYYGRAPQLAEDAEDMDLSKMLGRPGMLTITHTESGDKTFANVMGFSKPQKSMMASFPSDTHNELFNIDLTDTAKCTDALLQRVGKKSRERILASPEYKQLHGGGVKQLQDDAPAPAQKQATQKAPAQAATGSKAPAKKGTFDIDDEIPF